MTDHIADLKAFLDASPVNFLAVDELRRRLDAAGFSELRAADAWTLRPGDRRYVCVNGSALMAFVVGDAPAAAGFRIIAAHSDSPCFRVKPRCEMLTEGGVVRLNTEVYGGPILYTWFDRPLSLAGRAVLRGADALHPECRTVRFDKPMLVIPHLAIHFNRAVNEGNPLSRQKDMLPVLGCVDDPARVPGMLRHMVAAKLDVDPYDVLDYDLSLYTVEGASVVGLNGEYITSGRLDDLSMVHAALTALLASEGSGATRVMAIFDNEETGSGTKQGAASPVLDHTLRRICAALGGSDEDYYRAVADSFMVSADNAHGFHPNYAEKYDPVNHPLLGGGPVIKINANCKYMTDADSAAVFAAVCDDADVPVQYFVNHSDVAGGSTLGNILTSQIPLRGVDMGAAVWAMHSAREKAST
ncbi:MAG: M18 family aminopeptidase, partial [Muribaculaceae bacterium]|nr:M18 family aminopeptidase [Muribaculaceae bacterium]